MHKVYWILSEYFDEATFAALGKVILEVSTIVI